VPVILVFASRTPPFRRRQMSADKETARTASPLRLALEQLHCQKVSGRVSCLPSSSSASVLPLAASPFLVSVACHPLLWLANSTKPLPSLLPLHTNHPVFSLKYLLSKLRAPSCLSPIFCSTHISHISHTYTGASQHHGRGKS
jgi:hypothetical protein